MTLNASRLGRRDRCSGAEAIFGCAHCRLVGSRGFEHKQCLRPRPGRFAGHEGTVAAAISCSKERVCGMDF